MFSAVGRVDDLKLELQRCDAEFAQTYRDGPLIWPTTGHIVIRKSVAQNFDNGGIPDALAARAPRTNYCRLLTGDQTSVAREYVTKLVEVRCHEVRWVRNRSSAAAEVDPGTAR